MKTNVLVPAPVNVTSNQEFALSVLLVILVLTVTHRALQTVLIVRNYRGTVSHVKLDSTETHVSCCVPVAVPLNAGKKLETVVPVHQDVTELAAQQMVIVTSVSLVTMETPVNINAEVAVSRVEHVTKQMGNVIVLLDGQETNVINVWNNVHHATGQVAVVVTLARV